MPRPQSQEWDEETERDQYVQDLALQNELLGSTIRTFMVANDDQRQKLRRVRRLLNQLMDDYPNTSFPTRTFVAMFWKALAEVPTRAREPEAQTEEAAS